jgi:transposase
MIGTPGRSHTGWPPGRAAAGSRRALADRYGVHRRTVLQALRSPVPAPRKPLPPRKSRLEPYKDLIRNMIQEDPDARGIVNTLATEHGMTGISYSTVRNYVISLRGTSRRPRPATRDTVASQLPPGPAPGTPAMTWSPAHRSRAGRPAAAEGPSRRRARHRGRRRPRVDPAAPRHRRRGRDLRALAGRRDHAGVGQARQPAGSGEGPG